MAAARALQVVKQIQVLADGPETPEMRACLEQVVSSLQFFLEHPDSRVRIGSARTLLKLCRGYADAMTYVDLSKTEKALSRITDDLDKGTAPVDAEELQQILSETLGKPVKPTGTVLAEGKKINKEAAATSSTAPSSTAPARVGTEDRGEVVIKLGEMNNATAKAVVLDRIVNIHGVVSVTFERDFVVIATRTAALDSYTTFVNELISELASHGIVGVQLVSPSLPGISVCDVPNTTSDSVAMVGETQDDEDEPSYLDDEGDESGAEEITQSIGLDKERQWSFFAQDNWITYRRVQEHGEDPRIAARLAKAKQREEEKRKEDQSRIGRIFSALSSRWVSSS